MKKDYLKGGAMADSADLVVLGAYFGTGDKVCVRALHCCEVSFVTSGCVRLQGGLLSVYLMGCYDEDTKQWKTCCKCGNGASVRACVCAPRANAPPRRLRRQHDRAI